MVRFVGIAVCVVLTALDSSFRFVDTEPGSLTLQEGGKPVLVYHHGIQKKQGVPEDRQRSSYVHAIYGLDGEILTDDFPEDHYHHRGLFWAWPHIRIGGQQYDLWMLRGIQHRFIRWKERQTTSREAILGIENGWYVGDKQVVREEVRFVIGAASARNRDMDVELRWTAVKDPVTLWGAEGKSYGGLSLRFAPRQETVITTSKGVQSRDLNETRLTWADLSGRFAGASKSSGVTILVGPNHPDHPPTWITRHYGFLGIGWPGTKPGVLEPGSPVVCRYRLRVHRGTVEPTEVEQTYRAWISRE